MSDNVLYLGTSIPINYMIGSRPVSALYSGQTKIWPPKKPVAFVKAEGDWTQNLNAFTSNKISDDQSTIEKVYFKNLGGKTITITYDVDSESSYDYLTIFVLDSETEILATSKDNSGDYEDEYSRAGSVGSVDFTFPNNEEHFICLKYSKDSSSSYGRDNAIVTFPVELFGESKWIVVGEVIRYKYENDALYKYVYQDLQLSFNGILTDTHKDGELISKELIPTTIISPDDTIKLDNVSYGFWVPEVDPNKVYNLSFNSPTSIVFGNPIKISSWNITTRGMLGEIRGLNFVDTSNMTNMNSMFNSCGSLTSLNLSGWNVSNVTNMGYMFNSCGSLTSLNLSGWNVSNVTNMNNMFYYCNSLTSLDGLSGWDTSNVTNMNSMFCHYGATSLDLSRWDTSKVTNMNSMFSYCKATSLNLSGWNVSNVTNMDSMFYYCEATSLNLSGWVISDTTSRRDIFSNDHSLRVSLNLSGWDTSKVTDMSSMFEGYKHIVSLDVSGWDVSNVTNMNSMFAAPWNDDDFSSLASLDGLSGWDTSNVTDMGSMFYYCGSLTSLDVSGWNVSKVTNMNSMFCHCGSLTSLNLSGWDVSKVTDMRFMFSYCGSLTSLDGLSGWDTSNVTDMRFMFHYCGATSLNLSGWNVSNVTNMDHMFNSCSATSLNLSGWDVSKVTSGRDMFSHCKATSLNLSGWDVSKVTDMNSMFHYCSSLTSLNLSGWDVSKVTDMYSMFYYCNALTTITGPITGISTSIDLMESPLTHDSAMVFINGLNTVTETKTITFKSTTYGTLTEAEIAATTAKGWTVKSAA